MLDPRLLLQAMDSLAAHYRRGKFNDLDRDLWFNTLKHLSDPEFRKVADFCLNQDPQTTRCPTAREILAIARPLPPRPALPASPEPLATAEQFQELARQIRARNANRQHPTLHHPIFGRQPTGRGSDPSRLPD